VLAGHGFRVVAADRPLPTPVGVHAIRQMRAAAGIVVTASHNPPHDNGLKLYMGDGAQIIPPVDAGIASAIGAVAVDGVVVPPDTPPGVIDSLPDAVVEDYVRATLARVPAASEPLSLAVTAMHGVGGALLVRVLHEAGFSHVAPVPEQQEPDPDFPTVGFPNPEEPGATALLARTMTESGASLGLALDPDADRVAALVGAGGEAVPLTGDEVGALLAEWLLAEVTEGAGRLVVASVVSSQLLRQIAAHHGAAYAETLTGFKWLCRPAMDDPSARQVLAYEEALGYAIGLDARDKDGISAALGLASMASALAARGQTLLDALDEIHLRHGAHVTENFSLRDDRPGATARRDAAVTALHESPPEEIAGEPVEGVEIVVEGVLGVRLAPGVRILIRPSGTEPKLKCYCEAVERATRRDALPEARERARRRLSRVRDALTGLLVS
jgi:phosphomannomutase